MIERWLHKHQLSLLFILILFILGGLLSAFRLPVLLFPNIQFPRILVLVDSGDRPVDRMVVEVTQVLEQALRSVPGIQAIRSTSSRGSAELSVNFDWSQNMSIALLQVQSAINQVLPNLPAGTSFDARRMDPTKFPILGLTLTSKSKDLVFLRDFAFYQLRPLLANIPGVAYIEVLGGQNAEFHVVVDTAKLRAQNIALDDVIKVLTANNVVTAIGQIEDNYKTYLVLSDTRFQNIEDIKHVILASSQNGIVELEDVAKVVSKTVPQRIRVTGNGQDAVLLNVLQQAGANTISISKEVEKRLINFKEQLPKDIQIKTYYDQSKLIIASIKSVGEAIVVGAFLAAGVLILFLRNLRMILIVSMILPCVLITTVLFLDMFKMSFNIMTLGGMAAAAGLIIDDGVVMLEHIMRRLSEKKKDKPIQDSVIKASMQMLQPLAGSSIATIIIFLPLAFLEGVVGGFFKAVAITMASSLIISFFFVFLVVPLLGKMLLKQPDAEHLEAVGPKLRYMYQHYRTFMEVLLSNVLWPILSVILIVIIGYVSFDQVGSGFMPKMDEGGFILDYTAPPGTSLTETDRLLQQVEKIIMSIPEVDSYSRRTGLQLGGGLTESNTGDFFIHLKALPRRNIQLIMTELRNRISTNVIGLKIETAQLMEDLIGDLTAVPQPIEIKIFGENQTTLQYTAEQIFKILSSISGVVEIKNGIVISGDAIIIKLDPVKVALLNLEAESITNQIRTQLMGTLVRDIQIEEKLIGIRVWSHKSLRERRQELNELFLRSIDGRYISLKNVADISVQQGQAQMTRENLKSMIAVTARIEGRDLGSTMDDIQKSMQQLKLPLGVSLQYGGLYQEQQKSFYQMTIVFISAVLLVIVLLLFMYENIFMVFSIILTALLSLSGVFLGLWLTGTELNISSMLGMTMIIGIVTEIAIFYFSELNGHTQHTVENVIVSGIMRMRPILMTSIITILTLLPLALGLGTGSAMQQPLAIAIIFGLLSAVPFVLLLMPALYSIFMRFRHNFPLGRG